MNIVIPTFRRLDRQLTLNALAPELRKDVTLVVRNEEYLAHFERYGDECRILGLPGAVDDLLKTRQWIWEACNHARFVMCDDDILAFERPGQGRIRDAEQQRQMLRDLEVALDAGAGVSSPRTHWTPPHPKGMAVQSAADVVQFAMLDGPRLKDLGLRWDRIKYVEDQDFVLQVLSHGIDCVQLRGWSFSASSLGEGEGGLNVLPDGTRLTWADRAEIARTQGAELAKLWPDHVKPSKRKAGHHTVYRMRLLKEAQWRLGKREPEKEGGCPGCGSDEVDEGRTVCAPCHMIWNASGPDAQRLIRLGRFFQRKMDPGSQKRGRPRSGAQHPIVQRFADGRTFRVGEVADLYASRSSASVSLANMVGRGVLERVTVGVYRVKDAQPQTTTTPSVPGLPDVTARTELTSEEEDRIWDSFRDGDG